MKTVNKILLSVFKDASVRLVQKELRFFQLVLLF